MTVYISGALVLGQRKRICIPTAYVFTALRLGLVRRTDTSQRFFSFERAG
jgi:hypothetical protein